MQVGDANRADTASRLRSYFDSLTNYRGKTIETVNRKTTQSICEQFNINYNEDDDDSVFNELYNIATFEYPFEDYQRLVERDFERKEGLNNKEFKKWYDNQKGSYLGREIFPNVFQKIERMIEILLEQIQQSGIKYNDEIEQILEPYLFLWVCVCQYIPFDEL